MVNIGVVQGRLSKPVYGHIQEFPFDTWEREFDDLKELGLSHIEWIVTKESFDKNPLFTRDLSTYPISAICLDNIVDDVRFLSNSPRFVEEQIQPVLDIGKKLKKPVIYPTLNLKVALQLIDDFDILEETNLIHKEKKHKIVYDTGNVTSTHNQHEEFINNYWTKIHTVHLKDRFKDGRPAFPGTGDADFPKIFTLLRVIDQCSFDKVTWTMQTARGLTGLEKETIHYHKLFFEKLYNDYIF